MAEYDERKYAESRNKDTSYFRIGLYKYSRQYGHENFCDVHLTWPSPHRHNQNLESRDGRTLKTIPANWKAWYSGPNDSVLQIQRLGRSRREMEEYDFHHDVGRDLDIGEGGQGLVVSVGNWPQTKPKAFVYTNKVHVWLFGPLLLDDRPYGSLFFELTGPFVRDMRFRPLMLKGSRYHEGLKDFIPRYTVSPADAALTYEQAMERQQRGVFPSSDYYEDLVVRTYDDRVKGTYPATLSDATTRWEWTVESYTRNVTSYKAMRKSG